QVVSVNDDAMVKVIDIDLDRRRISLSLKQADEDFTEDFDPSKYGMADSYDEAGNYIFPEGFDPETNEWLEGFEKQREEWENRYAEAERRHRLHAEQIEKGRAAAEEAAVAAPTNYPSEPTPSARPAAQEAEPAEPAGGSPAPDAQRAAGPPRRPSRPSRPAVRWPRTSSWPPCARSSPAASDRPLGTPEPPRTGDTVRGGSHFAAWPGGARSPHGAGGTTCIDAHPTLCATRR